MNLKQMTLLACSAVLALPAPASAAADYFLTFDGINGSSTDKTHKGAIDIDSFSWGLSVANSGSSGGSAGKPVFSDFSWTQSGSDISFPSLFVDAAEGKHIKTAVLDLVKLGGDKPFSYLTMTFSDVILTGVQVAGSSGSVPGVNGSFAYGKVEMKVTPQLPKGEAGTPVTGTWDLKKGTGNLFTGSPLPLMQIANMSAPVPALAVPEPETYAMMLAGLGLVGFAVSRRAAV
ncbi:MAG: hypothetical protein B7X81_12910 [Hydrogenophilales bacterium 17-61-76]|nr:MAG: hypothetical protein B7Y21_12845 [Hydrogenophilales bacterium 16-61-112]OZA42488.1 MAG: hypothetical protein B7X81_12910 [Hydrogenophilales bacterium 17-61-76]